MVHLTLPSHLFEFELGQSSRKTLSVGPGPWPEIVAELRARFPRLAERVLTASGTIGDGFALVVNNEAIQRDCAGLELRNGDEFSIIAAIAGG
jgi:molybdopterin converting factor small subunit